MRPLPPKIAGRFARLACPANRFALREMVRATIKIRHQNSLLGISWNLLSPLVSLTVLFLVFHRHFGERLDAYPVYLLTGIVVVGFFIASSQHLVTLFERTRDLIQNSLVPTETGLVANLAPHGVRLGVEILLCVILSGYYRGLEWQTAPLIPLVLLSLVCLSAGAGLALGILYTFTQDVEQIWTVVVRLLFFVTPVFYDLDSLAPRVQSLIYWGNPLTPVLAAMRMCLVPGQPFELAPFLHGVTIGPVVLIAAYVFYLSAESRVMENA